MEIWGWILIVGVCTLVAIWFMYPGWKLEPFVVSLRADAAAAAADKPGEWVLGATDHQVRVGNVCRVLQSFADPELAGAVVEIVDASCESGLPHTIGTNRIRIPESAWNSSAERRQGILRHERVHLLQRRDPAAWEAFYRDVWQYTTHAEPPAALRAANIRGNPDTFPHRWACWKGRYWFVPVYAEGPNIRLQDASVRIWDAVAGTWLDEPPYEWRTAFCDERGRCPHQSEHPAEISAEYVTDLDTWTTPAAMSLRRFFSQFNF